MNKINFNFGEIISGGVALDILKDELSKLTDADIVLASAYTKLKAIKNLSEGHIHSSNNVRILTRWKPDDLISKASDLECFDYAKSNGWLFYIKPYFHAKAYLLGNKSIFIGSANLTQSGFSINSSGNEEGMVQIDASSNNVNAIEKFFNGATQVNDDLYLKIADWIRLNQDSEQVSSLFEWPDKISEMINNSINFTGIGCSDCFWTDGLWLQNSEQLENNMVNISHDLSLLGFQSLERCKMVSKKSIEQALNNTGLVRWLRTEMQKKLKKEFYFGELTSALHDVLIDDPKPYRQEIKKLVSNLLSWLSLYSNDFILERPNYSQKLTMIS